MPRAWVLSSYYPGIRCPSLSTMSETPPHPRSEREGGGGFHHGKATSSYLQGRYLARGRRRGERRERPAPTQDRIKRVFTPEYKLAILAEFDRCTEPGEKGAILRREGLYSSLITDWRRQHRQGLLKAAMGRQDGGRGGPTYSEIQAADEVALLRTKLAQAEAIIEVQGKVHALLEEISKSAASDDVSPRSWTGPWTSSPVIGRRRACQVMGRPRAGHYRARRQPLLGPPSRRPHRVALERPRRSSRCSTPSGSATRHRLRSGRRCWTRASTWPRSRPSTASSESAQVRERRRQARRPPTSSRSWWRRARRGVELGHHQAGRPLQVDLVPALRDPGRLQPLRRQLAGGQPGVGHIGRSSSLTPFTPGRRCRQLTIHADRGSSMTSKTVSQLLSDLGVLQSHSRPHQSNDNPYSEAQFKTLKYSPTFPKRFANIADARAFCSQFFDYYNNEHRHSGIGLNTPADVHFGRAESCGRSARACSTPPTPTPNASGTRRGTPAA